MLLAGDTEATLSKTRPDGRISERIDGQPPLSCARTSWGRISVARHRSKHAGKPSRIGRRTASKRRAQRAHHSTGKTPPALMTSPQTAASPAMKRRAASGLLPTGSAERSAKRLRISAVAIASATSALI
jgi:hypothetical protein